MKVKNLLWASCVVIVMAACNDDPLGKENGNVVYDGSNTYLELSFSMPTASSTRANPEEEPGLDFENTVSSVLVVVVDDNNQIAFTTTIGSDNLNGSNEAAADKNATYTTKNPIRTTLPVMEAPAEGGSKNSQYEIFVFVNPYEGMASSYPAGGTFDEEAELTLAGWMSTDVTGGITLKNITTNDNFLMSNADKDRTLTYTVKEVEEDGVKYNATVYSGEVNVERSMARFDYRHHNNGSIYYLKDQAGGEEATESDATVKVTLTDYVLMNVGKSFYHLKRVSDSNNGTSYTIGGAETGLFEPTNENKNYVVDADWTEKKDGTATQWGDLFFNYMGNGEDGAAYKALPGTDDQADNLKTPDGYYVMEYCTENTIPSTAQRNGQTTAVVFKAKIETKDNSGTWGTPTAGIYTYQNTIYTSWSALADVDGLLEQLNQAWKASGETEDHFTKDTAPAFNNTTEDGKKTIEICQEMGIAYYPATGEEDNKVCECYYIYWNRHNDNKDDTLMGIMEFAVVRNNVYKLEVTNISALGHPNDPTDPDKPNPDPEEPEPEDPDEMANSYLEVNVEVQPWTVKWNGIVFD